MDGPLATIDNLIGSGGIGEQVTIPILRQQKDWVGGVGKWPIFADVQYCTYADTVGGSEKVHNYADVI